MNNWNYAIENGGFYFYRAKYLKMKAPTRETVDAFDKDFDTLTEEQQKLVIDYHSAFKDAEASASTAI
jgi:hypothetical protein